MNAEAVLDDYVRRLASAGEDDPALQARLEFEARVARHALLRGVRPSAVQYVVPLAAQAFELRDDELKVKNGDTNPHDPLRELTLDVWLEEKVRREMPFLFAQQRAKQDGEQTGR